MLGTTQKLLFILLKQNNLMKKFTLFMSLLTLMIVGLQARAAVVYVATDDPTFNVYTWSPEQFGGWPGTLITEAATLTEVNGTQYYKMTLEGTGRFIIFNKNGVQTQNIPLQDGDNFFTYPVNGNFGQYETTNPPIEITSYTIAGDATLMGASWDPAATDNDMTLQGDGTYQLVKADVQLSAGSYQYKVVGNHAWSLWEVPQQGNDTLTIAEDGKYNVTFTLTLGDDASSSTLTAVAEKVEDVVIEHNYTIAGDEALMGSSWSTDDESNLMALQEDGSYQLVKENVELNAQGYEYKVVRDHSWDWAVPQSGNQTLSIAEAGKYNVTFTLTLGEENVLTATAEKIEEQPVEITSYTIVGDSALVGAAWNPELTANDMALQEDGSYQLVKENVELNAQGYEYKVTANHTWQVWEVPMQGNQTLSIAEAGKYNVTFTLTLGEENVLTATAEKIEEQPVEITSYTIVGDSALVGAAWNPELTDNDMVLQEDGTYKLVKENLELEAKGYEYKVTANHTWQVWEVPMQGNQTLDIAEAGKYNVTFTLTLGEENVLTATAEKIEEPQPEPKYLLHYGLNEEGAEWADVEFVENEGVLEATAEFAENTEFVINYGDLWYGGIVASEEEAYYLIHAGWCNDIPLATDGHKNFHINEAGTYTFVLTIGEEGVKMDVLGFPAPVLHGDVNGDGFVDVGDIGVLVNIMLGTENAADYPNANVDGLGSIDVSDVNEVVNIMLGLQH